MVQYRKKICCIELIVRVMSKEIPQNINSYAYRHLLTGKIILNKEFIWDQEIQQLRNFAGEAQVASRTELEKA